MLQSLQLLPKLEVDRSIPMPNPTFGALLTFICYPGEPLLVQEFGWRQSIRQRLSSVKTALAKALNSWQNTLWVCRNNYTARLSSSIGTNQILQLTTSSSSWHEPEWRRKKKKSHYIFIHWEHTRCEKMLPLRKASWKEDRRGSNHSPSSHLTLRLGHLLTERNEGHNCPDCFHDCCRLFR